jgi:hypothetical protein
LVEFFSFEKQEGNQVDDDVHFGETLASGDELGEHFGVAVGTLVEVGTGEDVLRILDGVVKE